MQTFMLMTNKLTLPVESRMQGDLHVRFGGRLWETYHRKVVRRPSPSLHV
ncbi:conjugative transposon protein TraN, partial [Bacteroides uniformis]